MKKFLLALLLFFSIGCVMAVDYSGYDYEDYVYVSNISTNGSVQAIPIYLVSSYDNYDFNHDGSIDIGDVVYAKTHGYILYPPDKINSPDDVNFDDGQYQLPAQCVYINKSKQVYAEYIVYTDKPAFYVRLHALYPHPLLTYSNTPNITIYPYWIENSTDGLWIWTKVNISANGNLTIYIKKTPGYHPDGNKVFDFFDDFDGTSLDKNKWVMYGTPAITVSNGILSMSVSNRRNGIYAKINLLGQNYIVTIKQRLASGGEDSVIYFGNQPPGSGGYLFHKGGWTNTKNAIYQGWWVGTELTSASYTWDNNWHVVEHIIKSNGLELRIDGSTNLQWSGVVNENMTYLGILQWTGCTWEYDYIYIRKYADQEPTVTVEELDNITWKVTIHNPNSYDLINFQVKIPGNGIVTSTDDSLLITNYPMLLDKQMSMSDVTPNTHTFTISGNPGAIVGNEYTVSFNYEAGRIIDWGDGTTTSTSSTTATHVYETVGTYTILATQYDTPWNIHRSLTVLVSSNVVNITANFYYEDGTPINDTNVTLIYALGQNITNSSTINVTTLANTVMTAKIGDIVRQIWVRIGDKNISFYFPRQSDYIVQEILKSYNSNDFIQVYLRDKLITEGYGEVNTYLSLGNVYKIYVNGQYYQDLIVDNTPDTILIKVAPVLEKILVSETPTAYEIYAKTSEAKFLTVKIYVDGTLKENTTAIASPDGATTYIWKTTVDSWFANENVTTYHIITIEVYDGPVLVAWNKFLFVHYSAPPKTQTMAWMVLVLGLVVVGCVFLLPRQYAWATMLLGAATIYVLGTTSIFNLDFDMFKIAGLLIGLGVVLYILTNIKR